MLWFLNQEHQKELDPKQQQDSRNIVNPNNIMKDELLPGIGTSTSSTKALLFPVDHIQIMNATGIERPAMSSIERSSKPYCLLIGNPKGHWQTPSRMGKHTISAA